MPKFIKIDLLENLEKIMKQNTKSYQSDFEIDRKILIDAAKNTGTVPLRERTYLWMSRPCGTWCVKERNVFLEPTYSHNIWNYYADETMIQYLADTGIQSTCQMTAKHWRLFCIRKNEREKKCGVGRLRTISGDLRHRS